MWNDKKPWWQKKAKDNQTDNSVKKNWCVIKVATGFKPNINKWEYDFFYIYKAVVSSNAPKIYTVEGKMQQAVEVDNLTKHEAYCVAKGLNFFESE